MHLVLLMICMACLAVVASSQSGAARSWAQFCGCYRLVLGPWVPPLPAKDSLRSFAPPQAIRLQKTARRKDDGGYPNFPEGSRAVTPLLCGEASRFRRHFQIGSWLPEGKHGIRIVWSTGKIWVIVHLTKQGNRLVGRIETGSDALGQPMSACTVEANKTECPQQRHRQPQEP
ncbi:MAG: hypothetical protein WBS54_10240 [Acidobacteriota bacterium]